MKINFIELLISTLNKNILYILFVDHDQLDILQGLNKLIEVEVFPIDSDELEEKFQDYVESDIRIYFIENGKVIFSGFSHEYKK